MPEVFMRKQSLLRREDGQAAGFVRFEGNGSRCEVEIGAEGIVGEARALLLRPESGHGLSLGNVRRGKGTFSLRTEELLGYVWTALLSGDKLLLVGGDGADFRMIRRQIANQAEAKKAPAPAAPTEVQSPPRQTAQYGPEPKYEPQRRAEKKEEPARRNGNGWVFTPSYAPNAPQQITGRYLQDGQVLATLQGVAGVYAPEPPPGLMGFVWDAGYWLKVDA